LDAPAFDEEWKWIGSYPTWRAAMLAFIYPENILLPSLRKWQTPAFDALVKRLRSNQRLTPAQACSEAAAYSDYFLDVCSLNVEASCQALTRTDHESCFSETRYATYPYRTLFFMFARSGSTSAVYCSAYDPQDPSGYAQTPWEVVPGLENVVDI